MNTCEFSSPKAYLESKQTLYERVKAIELLIDAMILSLADTASNANTFSYSLDDGQVKINTVYRSPKEVQSAVEGLEKIKQIYLNRLNGRVFVLRPEQSFRR